MPEPNKFGSIEALDAFKKTEQLCDEIWGIVAGWDGFSKDTIGKQLVRGADSIGANLAEGDVTPSKKSYTSTTLPGGH